MFDFRSSRMSKGNKKETEEIFLKQICSVGKGLYSSRFVVGQGGRLQLRPQAADLCGQAEVLGPQLRRRDDGGWQGHAQTFVSKWDSNAIK